VFGFSFGEFVMICVVALVFVGPQKLPGVLRTMGQWIRKARSMVHDMRAQSGIDDLLRAEGFHGGINELRSLMRGAHAPAYDPPPPMPEPDPSPRAPEPTPSPYYREPMFGFVDIDLTKEYPPEGPDAYGALPDDLFDVPRVQAPPPPPDPLPQLIAEGESSPDGSVPPAQSAPAA
jgi:sec-independent protein translocase protein TatB